MIIQAYISQCKNIIPTLNGHISKFYQNKNAELYTAQKNLFNIQVLYIHHIFKSRKIRNREIHPMYTAYMNFSFDENAHFLQRIILNYYPRP